MGTTASAAPLPVPLEGVHGNGMADSKQSLSVSSFQTVNIHSSKAKSIITNKVAPVVITYNCRQEFQIHDDLLRTNYKVGRISDTMPEHYLVQGSYFMVQDVYSKADVVNTTASHGAPNFRQVKEDFPVFGMGQPSLNGFRQVLQRMQSQGHEEVIFFCVREEPVVFLHLEDNFVPYTPRRKENLHENLHDLGRDQSVDSLELIIRKELHDFAKLGENVFYVYNDIEHFKDEPQKVAILCEEDIQVTEEVFKRPVFTMPSYSYHRLPLPTEGAPLEQNFDAFVKVLKENPSLSLLQDPPRPLPALIFSCQVGVGRTNLGMILGTLVLKMTLFFHYRTKDEAETKPLFQIIKTLVSKLPEGQTVMEEVDHAIAICSDMHDIKEAIYENKKKLEGIGEDYQFQVGDAVECLVFDLYPLAFACSFSRWLCANAWIYRLLARMNISELRAPADLVSDEYLSPDVLSTVKEMKVANFRRVPKMPIYGMAQPTSEAITSVLSYLSDEKRRHGRVLWVNLQEELVLEGNGEIFCPREPTCLDQHIPVPMMKSCRTLQEIFNQHKSSIQGLEYRRAPLIDCCSPHEQDFDRFLDAMKSTLAEDSTSAFVFNCSNGKGRSTTAMVIATLTLWHFNGFPEFADDEIVSVPDAKYTKGEFEVVMQLVRLLPDGHRVKREVDMALDSVSETMTPMHYHLREIIICTYRQIKTVKCEADGQRLLLRSLQYLERYMYLILFNSYLHLEKKESWQRPFSVWMQQVALRAGVYEILNRLGFSEFENPQDSPLSTLRHRWQRQTYVSLPFRGDFF
uniref:Paladin n=1 Tax=Denticeps clupeoides TaxID=299321 RepID=A0AAY3ZXC0_9TELE